MKPFFGSDKTLVADSWFGSVRNATELMNRGIYSIMVVKTAHKFYPEELKVLQLLERGEWATYVGEYNGVKLMAVKIKDLKQRMYIATASTSLEGAPRVTKYHGSIKRPQVAAEYCDMSASVDIHNHYRTGSIGLEDAVRTKSGFIRQVCGVMGFLATNAFLTTTNFFNFESPRKPEHLKFKMELASRLMNIRDSKARITRCHGPKYDAQVGFIGVHAMKKFPGLRNNKLCYYCRHGYAQPTQ